MLVLSSCASGETGPAILDEPATSEDALPGTLSQDFGVEAESARLAGSVASTSIFVARDTAGHGICLVAVEDDEWASACSPHGEAFELGFGGSRFAYEPSRSCAAEDALSGSVCVH
jgi:hypothetical protein